ncbi:PIN domain nuclease [soil metagenome]
MALTYLLDTSVVARLSTPLIGARLTQLDSSGVARTAMTDLEVGFSARTGTEWGRLTEALGAFAAVDIETRHFDRARQVQRELAARSLRGRKIPDLLIAAVAESRSMVVLHYDADFDHIAAVTHQATEWILPRGSID